MGYKIIKALNGRINKMKNKPTININLTSKQLNYIELLLIKDEQELIGKGLELDVTYEILDLILEQKHQQGVA